MPKAIKKVAPDLTLNMDEKIYLAVSKDTTGKLAFVYTLACLSRGALEPGQYNLMATRELHAFRDKESAEIFHDSVQKIVEINAADEKKNIIFSANEDLIQRFQEQVR